MSVECRFIWFLITYPDFNFTSHDNRNIVKCHSCFPVFICFQSDTLFFLRASGLLIRKFIFNVSEIQIEKESVQIRKTAKIANVIPCFLGPPTAGRRPVATPPSWDPRRSWSKPHPHPADLRRHTSLRKISCCPRILFVCVNVGRHRVHFLSWTKASWIKEIELNPMLWHGPCR